MSPKDSNSPKKSGFFRRIVEKFERSMLGGGAAPKPEEVAAAETVEATATPEPAAKKAATKSAPAAAAKKAEPAPKTEPKAKAAAKSQPADKGKAPVSTPSPVSSPAPAAEKKAAKPAAAKPAPAPAAPATKKSAPAVAAAATNTENGTATTEDATNWDDVLSLVAPSRQTPTRLVSLVRDPEWVFLYWEIAAHDRQRHDLPQDRHDKTMALRVYELSTSGGDVVGHFDIELTDPATNRYYLRLEPGNFYRSEIGYYDMLGRFISLAGSQSIDMPVKAIAEEVAPITGAATGTAESDEAYHADWSDVPGHVRRIYEESGLKEVGRILAGSDSLPIMATDSTVKEVFTPTNLLEISSSDLLHLSSDSISSGHSESVSKR
jgi:hypothetical protein